MDAPEKSMVHCSFLANLMPSVYLDFFFSVYLTKNVCVCMYPAGSSRATQMEPAVLTFPMMAPSCGPEAWITLSAPGI